MFHTLHKIYLGICWLVVLGLAGWLYLNRAIFNPLVDLVDALTVRDGFQQERLGELSGKVTRVLDGGTFQLRSTQGQTYMIKLTGVEAPTFQKGNRAELLRAGESRTNLIRLVLSNEVRVELTYTNESRGALGIVYVKNTNANAVLAQSGSVHIRRDYMNGLPLKDRYALIQADRKAKERNTAQGD